MKGIVNGLILSGALWVILIAVALIGAVVMR